MTCQTLCRKLVFVLRKLVLRVERTVNQQLRDSMAGTEGGVGVGPEGAGRSRGPGKRDGGSGWRLSRLCDPQAGRPGGDQGAGPGGQDHGMFAERLLAPGALARGYCLDGETVSNGEGVSWCSCLV